ncbi:signal peptidase I [Actinospica sp.]|jgi:signal peptidase I|uniref:signal peptidase I n=1 Tax=Actinospica sp. TaxID=1872142 RepID=UPI002BDE9CA7|nr:signal peptidase I [Actinospica sp.]HWG28011.1 signal peptidase I [Actinospica sp.]
MTVERPETGLPEAVDPDEQPHAGAFVPAAATPSESAGAGPEPSGQAVGGKPEQEPEEAGGRLAGVARPGSALGWVLFPFAVVWRFLFPRKPRPFLVELPFLVVFALVLAFLIKTFLVQAFYIPSGSMQNTLQPGDRVLVNRAEQWLGGTPTRGEVVVFQDPGNWLETEGTATSSNWLKSTLTWVGLLPADDGDLIKRVIGVGGDHVVCCNGQGQITVNGVALNENYLYPGDEPNSGYLKPFDVTVPQGYLWVMGDHRSVSLDSRYHQDQEFGGMVPVGNVVGRADIVVWPISHWKTLPIPGTFKQVGLSALGLPGAIPGAALVGTMPLALKRRKRRRLLAAKRATTG